MILLQKQNINHSILSYKTLIEFSFHIGNLKKIRNNNNANFIINTPQKIDLINQTYTLLIFRKILLTITRIIENHGQILTIIPSTNLLLKIISQHIYITNWTPGLLSNFKELNIQKKYNKIQKKIIYKLPNFIFFLLKNKHNEFKLETKTLLIPIANIQSSGTSSENFIYEIPGNLNSTASINFFITLILYAINDGKKKKANTFMYHYINIHKLKI